MQLKFAQATSKQLAQEIVKELGVSICFAINRNEKYADLLHQYRCAVTLLFQLTEDPWDVLQYIQKEGYNYHE
ncbi:hypothetical protein [Pseudanabaena sp. 'Roaring Creek']|uniref:hypothetical protein n=1 Tax=Pseudanabaena sp. 'Roaring Creek' TaxID=1681830 RepID=UPI0006D79ADE|nr:hypothetical protein [Pseudanabaena sp. 'Roaring Creek']